MTDAEYSALLAAVDARLAALPSFPPQLVDLLPNPTIDLETEQEESDNDSLARD